jgi:hypothetical protein
VTRPFEVRQPPEQAYVRNVLFAIELLDSVTLERVSDGVKVVAEGLQGKPIVNSSGLFVWRQEDLGRLRKITIDPGLLPYDRVDLAPAQVKVPPLTTTVELPPRVDYAFAAGITGLRGVLIEQRVPSPAPVRDAEVHLRWLDDNGDWHDAPGSHTNTTGGDFAAILRFSPADLPLLDNDGLVTVRLRVRRGTANERESADLKLTQGRIADPSTFAQGPNALIFAWDELQP